VLGSAYGVKFAIDNFTKSLFYYLFMYGVGLRVGPSFVNSLGGDGLKFTVLAVISSVLGLALVVLGARMFDLPAGAARGLLAGSQTMSAAIGSAEQAITVITHGGTGQVSAMIALSYGITISGEPSDHPDHQVPAEMVGSAQRQPPTTRMASPAPTSRR
jgi:putative transport protein